MEHHWQFADNQSVKKFAIILIVFISFTLPLSAYVVSYKEQFYRMYHVHYQQYPDDVIENIYWLERAAAADFANPQYAMAKIKDKTDWEKYRYLFMMHINLKLIEQHLRLGRYWDKNVAYFYDAPWKEQYLRDLETAETAYKAGLHYWNEAKLWSEKARQGKFNFLYLTDIQAWEDENARIESGKLDYGKTIERELARLQKVKADFEAMDENTY